MRSTHHGGELGAEEGELVFKGHSLVLWADMLLDLQAKQTA
jgi:hypothetical protein